MLVDILLLVLIFMVSFWFGATLNSINRNTRETRQILTILHYQQIAEYGQEMSELAKTAGDTPTGKRASENVKIAAKLEILNS